MKIRYVVVPVLVCVFATVSMTASAFTFLTKDPQRMTLAFAKRDASADHKEQVLKDRFENIRDVEGLKSVLQYIASFNNAFIRIDQMRDKTTGLLSPSTLVSSIYGFDRSAIMRLESFSRKASFFTNVRGVKLILGRRGLDADQLLSDVSQEFDVARLHQQSLKIQEFLHIISTFMKSRDMK